MSVFENPEHMRLLQNLLNPQQRNDDSDTDADEDEVNTPLLRNSNITPANIGEERQKQQQPTTDTTMELKQKEQQQQEPKNCEEWQEMQEKEDADILDTRKCPEYTMTYRQSVGTEDVFLQMGNRTSSSASCEDLLLEILLPNETVNKMDLKITETEVNLSTPVYRLKLPMTHKINVNRSRAKYDADSQKLSLILRLQRELDFINF